MFEYTVFFFFAAVAVIFALVVITNRNPVVSALSLVVSFFALAVMYVLLDAAFLAALQVIVYAGAIMVLFLFVIMLLNLQHRHEPATNPIQQFLGYTGSAAFLITLVYYLVKYTALTLPSSPFHTDARMIGVALFEAYIFPFEMVSILLLAAIVGALLLSARAVSASPKIELSVVGGQLSRQPITDNLQPETELSVVSGQLSGQPTTDNRQPTPEVSS